MSRQYRKPPLVEAVAEFHFSAVAGWSEEVVTSIQTDLAEQFDHRSVVTAIEGRMVFGPEGISQHASPVERVRLSGSGHPVIVQLGPNLLSVNHLAPYTHWDGFAPFIRAAYSAYISHAKPQGLNMVMLNYVNRIEVPPGPVRLEDYFGVYPQLAAPLPEGHGHFLLNVNLPFEDARDTLRLQFNTFGEPGGAATAFLLVLQYVPGASAISMDDPFAVLEPAHQHIEDTFEGCMTDKTRSLFEEDSPC